MGNCFGDHTHRGLSFFRRNETFTVRTATARSGERYWGIDTPTANAYRKRLDLLLL